MVSVPALALTMHRNHLAPDNEHPSRPAALGTAATASPAPAHPVHRRQLERSVSWSGPERLRFLWYRLRLTVAEMNYATRRLAELQRPGYLTTPRPLTRHLDPGRRISQSLDPRPTSRHSGYTVALPRRLARRGKATQQRDGRAPQAARTASLP